MMTSQEARERLDPYFDGELPSEEIAALEAVLEGDPTLREELAELVAARALMNEAFDPELAQVDFSGFVDRVIHAIEGEASAPESARSHWLDRLAGALGIDSLSGGQFAGALALAAALGVGLWWMSGEPLAPETEVEVAGTQSPRTGGRRAMETEALPSGRHAATVVSWEAATGRVEITENANDPDQPMVVWHIEEGTAHAPDAGL